MEKNQLLKSPMFEGNFLKLRPDKAPLGWNRFRLSELDYWPDVGILLIEPFVVVDIDNSRQAEKLTKLVMGENLRCQIMQTDRGRHFWFTSAAPISNKVHALTGIGLTADYRSWGKMSQLCVKKNGSWRIWLTKNPWNELDQLPEWLMPIRQNKWSFHTMREGDGRNQALFEYQLTLSKSYGRAAGLQIINLINKYVFEEPLPEAELLKICRPEAWGNAAKGGSLPSAAQGLEQTERGYAEETDPWLVGKSRFLHNVMGDILISQYHIICYNRQLYVYKDGCYRLGREEILRLIVEKYPSCLKRQQNEVVNYLSIKQRIAPPLPDEYIINVRNGRLNLVSGELSPHSYEHIDFQQIPIIYHPNAYNEGVDKTLLGIFDGDWQLYRLFEEILGCCLVKNNKMHKIFIFVGDGGNGKSTLLRLIGALAGEENYSTLSLQDLETTFRPAELEHKLVNLGDDIPLTAIKDSSRLKSLASGERITVERKNKDPFSLKSYATLIFTTNQMPRVNDKSFGFYRRLILIPLSAAFSPKKEEYDISQKITSNEEAMSYLLNMAVRGLRRLLNRGFSRSDKVERAIETYRLKSSYTLSWVYENSINRNHILKKSVSELYSEFSSWCRQEGIENIPIQRSFTCELKREFALGPARPERNPITGRKSYYLTEPEK